MKNPIYLGVHLIVIIALLSLVKIPISSSSRGLVRSVRENTKIAAVVSDKVIKNMLEKID